MSTPAIVIATYNEAQSLPPLVDRLQALDQKFWIYVIDDNSPDGTTAKAHELAQRYGSISVITRPKKEGLGSALRRGIQAAIEDGCDYGLTMDADLSHDPDDMPRLLRVVQSGEADLALGSRYVKGGSDTRKDRRRLISRLANLAYHHLLGTPTDVTNNLRAFNRRYAHLVVNRSRARGFEFQPESTLVAMCNGLKISEVPVHFTERTLGESKLGARQALKGLLFFIMALLLYRLRLGRFSKGKEDKATPAS